MGLEGKCYFYKDCAALPLYEQPNLVYKDYVALPLALGEVKGTAHRNIYSSSPTSSKKSKTYFSW